MNQKEELEKACADLTKAENSINFLKKQLNEANKVEAVIVAAGLLDKDKFDEARTIVDAYSTTTIGEG